MRFLRPLFRVLAYIAAVCILLVALGVIALQLEQQTFRKKVELLLRQTQAVEMGQTTWQQAQLDFAGWSSERAFTTDCNSEECSFDVELKEFVYRFITGTNFFVRLDDYFRWRLKLHYNEGPFVRTEYRLLELYLRFGGHPARVSAHVGMYKGIVWKKGFWMEIAAFGHAIGWSGDNQYIFSLLANIYAVDALPTPYHQFAETLAQHPTFEVGRNPCTVCVIGWVKFTQDATGQDLDRLMQFNLSCLTQWRPCLTQADIIPAAWAESRAEHATDTQKF